MNWDAGAYWKPDDRAGVLRCGQIWSASKIEEAEFDSLTRKMMIARGVGLPGRVWTYGQAAWMRDVAADEGFPRVLLANQGALHGAFAFPVMIGNNVAGIVEIFSLEIREQDNDLLLAMTNIGNQLGQFFERKRMEENLVQSQNLEADACLA